MTVALLIVDVQNDYFPGGAMEVVGATAAGAQAAKLLAAFRRRARPVIHVRHISVRVLRSLGYDVIEAAAADDAQHLIAQGGQKKIHLLLTDMVMPQMSGRELIERLAPLRPQMKVLYMSGYTDDAIVRHGLLDERMEFIQKPFTADALARKIRSLLKPGRVEGLAGASLPMLIRALTYREEPLAAVVGKAVSGGCDGVVRLNSAIRDAANRG